MKKFILYVLILILTGCSFAGSLPVLNERPELSLVDGKGDFIELFSGQVVEGPITVSGNKALAINGKEYHVKEIKSYQYNKEYRTTVRNRFITRVVKGKINVYRQSVDHPGNMFGTTSSSRAGSTTIYYYLQKGDLGKISDFDIGLLADMVQDNPKAAEWVENYRKQKRKLNFYLDNAIAAYNSQ